MITVNGNTEDQGLHVGPTLASLEEGIFYSHDPNAKTTDQGKDEKKPEEAPKADDQPKPKLAGKYDKPEDLEKAYLELQKKLGEKKPEEAPKADEPKADGDEPKADGEEAPKADDAPKADEAPALDFAKLSEEWDANGGKLTDETQAGLTKLGITPEVTSLFYAGVEAIITSRASQVQALAGTADEYKSLVEWGSKNLPDNEKAAFDAALDKALYEGDTAAINLMIPAVKAKMAGDAPNYVQTRLGDDSGVVKAFANLAEQNAAIQDRRYGRDMAYTKEVERRIVLSNF